MYYSVVYMNVQVGLFFVAVAVLQLQLQWSAGPPGGLVPRSPEYKFYKKIKHWPSPGDTVKCGHPFYTTHSSFVL